LASACAALLVCSVFASHGRRLRPSQPTKAISTPWLQVRLEPLFPEGKSLRTSVCRVLGRSCFEPFPVNAVCRPGTSDAYLICGYPFPRSEAEPSIRGQSSRNCPFDSGELRLRERCMREVLQIKSRLKIGQADITRPSVAADRCPVRTTIIGAIDQKASNA